MASPYEEIKYCIGDLYLNPNQVFSEASIECEPGSTCYLNSDLPGFNVK